MFVASRVHHSSLLGSTLVAVKFEMLLPIYCCCTLLTEILKSCTASFSSLSTVSGTTSNAFFSFVCAKMMLLPGACFGFGGMCKLACTMFLCLVEKRDNSQKNTNTFYIYTITFFCSRQYELAASDWQPRHSSRKVLQPAQLPQQHVPIAVHWHQV